MRQDIFDPAVDKLATLLEEGARASSRSVPRFVEPMQGTLRRAQSKRMHLVFGRRGSGKSSLLYKSAESLSAQGFAVAYVDLEPFKGHHYPDVLISILLASFVKFKDWLADYCPEDGKRLWYTLWLKKKRTDQSALKVDSLKVLNDCIADLKDQLHLTDEASVTTRVESNNRSKESASLKGGIKSNFSPAKASFEANLADESESNATSEKGEAFKRSKTDYLHRKILDFHQIFDNLATLTGSDAFLFLDDLYHLARADQPQLLDYMHRIAKGHNLWIKAGTIKHRSTWYVHSPQPMGLKLGDDADEINLDITLEKFSTSRTFLSKVLRTYIEESNAPEMEHLLSDGGLNRLVIASGGVTRDFLGIFRRSIDEARDRLTKNPEHARGGKISAEDVNMASGSYGDTKREEFQKDTQEDQEQLDASFRKVHRFCLEKNKSNIFLIDQDISNDDSELVQELVDLRLIHHVKSRVTVSSRPGRVFRALLLDVSQYTGERKRRDIEMIEFWTDDREVLRKAGLIYDPSVSMEALEQEICQCTRHTVNDTATKSEQQTELELPYGQNTSGVTKGRIR